MKYISFAIPCYNSAEYMENCVNSILPGGEDVEIIIVDDGSKDETGAIADRLAAEHPTIIKAVHQENGGHGQAVNTGIKNATGLYFKVVDSDDKVAPEAYEKVLNAVKQLVDTENMVDLVIANYVYDKQGAKHKKSIGYSNLPKEKVFTWEECGHFKKGKYMLMHSVIYKTQVLRDCGLELPKHTFYVDNLYVFNPLPYVKTMYYLDVDFYLYFIGRDDQSVNEDVMISRIDQQIRVNKLMIDKYVSLDADVDRHVRRYMYSYLEIITVVSTILLTKSGTEENLAKRKELWTYIKNKRKKLFFRLRYGLLCGATNLPGKYGRKISVASYKLTRKVVGFN